MTAPHNSSDIVLAITTVATEEDAVSLVRALLSARLIACGSILPNVRSLYHWNGGIADETERMVMLKTVAAKLDEIGQFFVNHHPYEVPELMVFPTTAGLEEYLSWVRSETTD